jgi:hypothetical protein
MIKEVKTMKKKFATITILIVIIVILLVIVIFNKTASTTLNKLNNKTISHKIASSNTSAKNNNSKPQTSTNQTAIVSKENVYEPMSDACKILTEQIAQQIFGPDYKPVNISDVTNSSNSNTTVSTCVYTNGLTISSTNYESINLLAHTSLSSLGTSDNVVVFGSERPSDVTDVQGIGQASYWDPNASQLNILNDNNWYVVSLNKGRSQVLGNLTDVKAASQIIFKQGI